MSPKEPAAVDLVDARQPENSATMHVSFVTPRTELQPYIESLWVLESATGLPADDHSIAAPNGCAKLVIPYENSIVSVTDGRTWISHEHGLYFVGNLDTSALLRSDARRIGFVTIEFHPHGAFPIFGVPMSETHNEVCDAGSVFGRWTRETQEAINNLPAVQQKVALIQERLIALLRKNGRGSDLVTYCVSALRDTDGLLPIRKLEQQTGFSRRYLDMLFRQHVGLSPKSLAQIFRFQRFYRQWAEGQSFEEFKNDLYGHYYDQAHFTNEFRKMTGYPPRKFMRSVNNEFGRRLLLR